MFMYEEVILLERIMSKELQDIDTKDGGEVEWSTREELLLAFAVKRHGLKDWDAVATELQNRHRHHQRDGYGSTTYSPRICKDRYRCLKRRFTNNHRCGGGGGAGSSENDDGSKFQSDDDDELDGGLGGGGDVVDDFPWLEELRKLRVAELRQELHLHDVSIRSLQIKVKTMEEERENYLKADRTDGVKEREPDLDDAEVKREGSENDRTANNGEKGTPPAKVAGESVSGSAGDDENISFNESNSAGNRGSFLKTEPENQPVEEKPDPHVKPKPEPKPTGVGGGEDSCNDSSDPHEVNNKKNKINREKENDVGRSDSDESKEGTKESSDVQSSASLLTVKNKKKKVGRDGGGSGRGGGNGSTAPIKREEEESGGAGKLEPTDMFSLLNKIRGHKHGPVFERRLQIQKTEKYKKTIRRHVDLETIESRIDQGSYYSSCPAKFYVDLLLLFNNAIVFFPKGSSQSVAAQELRQHVTKELKKHKNDSSSSKPDHKSVKLNEKPERSDSLLPRNKPANPPTVVVCRRRSSVSAKPSTSAGGGKVEKQLKPVVKSPPSTSNEEEDSVMFKVKEKPVTGTRSVRRGSQGRTNISSKTEPSSNNDSVKNQGTSQHHGAKDKGDNKKKPEASVSTKKSSAADFLKRMKKNSPAKGTEGEASKNPKENTMKGGKKDQHQKKKADEPARRSGSGSSAGGKRQIKEENSPSKRATGRPTRKGKEIVGTGKKRGRDGGDGEGSSQRAKKRAR